MLIAQGTSLWWLELTAEDEVIWENYLRLSLPATAGEDGGNDRSVKPTPNEPVSGGEPTGTPGQ